MRGGCFVIARGAVDLGWRLAYATLSRNYYRQQNHARRIAMIAVFVALAIY